MGAEFLLIDKELGFFKLAHQIAQLDEGGGLGIGEVALRRGMPVDQGLV